MKKAMSVKALEKRFADLQTQLRAEASKHGQDGKVYADKLISMMNQVLTTAQTMSGGKFDGITEKEFEAMLEKVAQGQPVMNRQMRRQQAKVTIKGRT